MSSMVNKTNQNTTQNSCKKMSNRNHFVLKKREKEEKREREKGKRMRRVR